MKIYDEDQQSVIENRMKIDSFLVMVLGSLLDNRLEITAKKTAVFRFSHLL